MTETLASLLLFTDCSAHCLCDVPQDEPVIDFGSIDLSIMILPLIMRTTEALIAVPNAREEDGLGAGRLRTTFSIVPFHNPALCRVILGIGQW